MSRPGSKIWGDRKSQTGFLMGRGSSKPAHLLANSGCSPASQPSRSSPVRVYINPLQPRPAGWDQFGWILYKVYPVYTVYWGYIQSVYTIYTLYTVGHTPRYSIRSKPIRPNLQITTFKPKNVFLVFGMGHTCILHLHSPSGFSDNRLVWLSKNPKVLLCFTYPSLSHAFPDGPLLGFNVSFFTNPMVLCHIFADSSDLGYIRYTISVLAASRFCCLLCLWVCLSVLRHIFADGPVLGYICPCCVTFLLTAEFWGISVCAA